ncbi:MAG: diguanylate cyclase, partial [Terriglobus sp.]
MPRHGWLTAVALIAQMALAIAFCIRLRTVYPSTLHRKLGMAALGFLLWVAVYASVLWVEYVVKHDPPGAFAGDYFAGLRALPFLLALCWPPNQKTQPEEWIDAVQAVLLSVLLYVFLFPGFSIELGAPVPPIDLFLSTVFVDLNNLLLLVVAVLATLSSATVYERSLHRALTVLFLVFVVTSGFLNHVVIQWWNVPPGSPWFVIADLSIVLFLLSFRTEQPVLSDRAFTLRRSLRLYIQFGIPIVYSLAGFLFSVAIAVNLHHPYLGIALGSANLLLYAVRTARAQMRYELARRALEATNTSLRELSGKDALTGVYNRRWFAGFLEQIWKQDDAESFPLSLLLFDVDFFKKYNDQHGHIRGDECLISVATLLKENLHRKTDFLTRYGGEEFALLLPNTDAEGARLVAERLCYSVRQAKIPHASSSFGVVTVSVGVSTFASKEPHNVLPGLE